MDNHKISDFILDHNNQFIVATKPAGMPCVPDQSGDSNLKNVLEAYSKHDLHIITRTDRPVSGIALFAKSQNAAQDLSNQIKEGSVSKSYLAIVEKTPPSKQGELIHYLFKGRNNKSIVVDKDHKGAKKSILSYEVVAELNNYTVLKIDLRTGRFHQIRSQLSHIGSHIKGDVKYGARRKNKDRSICLHAYELSFNHPVSKERLTVTSQPDTQDSLWQAAMAQIGQ